MKKYLCTFLASLIVTFAVAYGAGEITMNYTLKVVKGSLNLTRTLAVTTNLLAGNPNMAGGTQVITSNTVGTAITLGDVATNGVAWFANLSPSRWVDIGVTNAAIFYPLMRINPGEAYPWRVTPGIQPYARAEATTTNVVIEKVIVDN